MTSIEGCGLVLSSGAAERAEVQPAVQIEILDSTYSTLLFRVAHAVLRNSAEAEDTVQEVFLRVLAHRNKLSQVRDMRVWLVRIAWRLALDRKRKTTPDQMDDSFVRSLAANCLPADKALAEARELEHVLSKIERLPPAEGTSCCSPPWKRWVRFRSRRCSAKPNRQCARCSSALAHACGNGLERRHGDEEQRTRPDRHGADRLAPR